MKKTVKQIETILIEVNPCRLKLPVGMYYSDLAFVIHNEYRSGTLTDNKVWQAFEQTFNTPKLTIIRCGDWVRNITDAINQVE